MKRFVGAALCTALLLVAAIPSATVAGNKWRPVDVDWRTSAVSVAGFVDSSTASINGALQTVDTTEWIPTQEFDLTGVGAGAVNTTAYGGIKVWIYGTTFTSVDTLFIAMETSPDAVSPIGNTTFSNMVATTAGDDAVSIHIQADSDAGNLNLWGAPFVRFRVRADGNTGALIANAKIRIAVPTEE